MNKTFESSVDEACQRIAPIWSLDKSIAVNPWWSMRHKNISNVSAKLSYLENIKLLMDKSYYSKMWGSQIKENHLALAIKKSGTDTNQKILLQYLNEPEKNISWKHLSDLLDQHKDHYFKMPWREEIIHQISQFSAFYFQYPEHRKYADDSQNGFYRMWLNVIQQDRGVEILMAEPGLNALFKALPQTSTELFEEVPKNFGDEINESAFTEYCHALLLDINGWASWMANAAWQAAFVNQTSNLLKQLLAVRLAWDLVLWRQVQKKSPEKFRDLRKTFTEQLYTIEIFQNNLIKQQAYGWIWQTALELSFQEPLQAKLIKSLSDPQTSPQMTELQAYFCIDVRSEPIRRALEAQSPAIKTSGFAGFFGLPIEYAIEDSDYVRPQLPGLLKASIRVSQHQTSRSNKKLLSKEMADKKSYESAPSTFGVVEAKGLMKAFDLLKNSFFPEKPKTGIMCLMTNEPWTLTCDQKPMDETALASTAANILTAMGLKENFPKTILLFGHASSTTNNPHAAGLDCGACGGQSGEVNVKVLAQILNSPGVRAGLQSHKIFIPDATQFVAGLHNTTTDELIFFESDFSFESESWKKWLAGATQLAQKNRSKSMGINEIDDVKKLKKEFERKANDWAQIRPEWGLANNAAFIVAPRALTKNIDLKGRSFLHDYDWKKDTSFSLLELIITAPMVVTNWINLQYYASVTDNRKYGSGNKLLHNVVGGHMGVFEGNGGDLRFGLPLQSIHDGKDWRHQPLRLSVYFAAPREKILEIILRHTHIIDLVKNGWIYIFQLDDEKKQIWELKGNDWIIAS